MCVEVNEISVIKQNNRSLVTVTEQIRNGLYQSTLVSPTTKISGDIGVMDLVIYPVFNVGF